MWYFPIFYRLSLALAIGLTLNSCQSSSDDPYNKIIRGTIVYPFYHHTQPLGNDGKDEKFVIRTIAGGTEYVVEIPHAASDYDVEVPIADMENGKLAYKPKNAQVSDRELIASMPKLSTATEDEKALMDKAFGTGEAGGPRQAPSYLINIRKINNLYRQNKYEYALIEINNLLAFYPTSAKLYKMKGTVLIKLGNLSLAERAWKRASELAPLDPLIKRGLKKLKSQIETNRKIALKDPGHYSNKVPPRVNTNHIAQNPNSNTINSYNSANAKTSNNSIGNVKNNGVPNEAPFNQPASNQVNNNSIPAH